MFKIWYKLKLKLFLLNCPPAAQRPHRCHRRRRGEPAHRRDVQPHREDEAIIFENEANVHPSLVLEIPTEIYFP